MLLLSSSLVAIRWTGHMTGMSDKKDTYRNIHIHIVAASKEIGLEVNADELSKWSCLEIRGQEEVTVKTDNSSFGKVEQFQYLGITLTNQYSIQEEI